MGKPAAPTIGYRYYFDIQMGLARAVDSVLTILAAGTVLWNGEIDSTQVVQINQPNIFGGDAGEGGVVGSLYYYDGGPTQVYDAGIKLKMGGLVPEFRGVATLYYSGEICAMNPYPKAWSMRVVRALTGWQGGTAWYPAKAQIAIAGTTALNGTIRAMNPAHIIYECATNSDWGRGLDPSQLDEPSFINAANILCQEGFGICLAWDRQNNLNDFVQTIINHIGASLYTDRSTGLLRLMLIRGDYDPNALPVWDATSGLLKIEDAQAGSGDVINEIIVQYINPLDQGRPAQLRVQNGGSIQAGQGAINSSTAQYPGLPSFDLAQRIGQRDLRVAASGLQTYKLTMDRRAWKIYPGMVFKVNAPERGINNLIVRAGVITDTSLVDGTITINVVQDVFGLPTTSYMTPETPAWVPPQRTPVILDFRRVAEGTYRDAARFLSPGDLAALDPSSGAITTLAEKPNGSTVNYAVSTCTDAVTFTEKARADFCGWTTTTGALGYYDTVLPFDVLHDASHLAVGQAGIIENEFVRIDAIDTVGLTMTIARGCVDTLPTTHVPGVITWFPDDFIGTDNVEYVASEVISVKLLSKTLMGELPPDVAPVDTVTIAARHNKPYVPGNLTVGYTDHLGTAKVVPIFDMSDYVENQIVFTWATRNRLTQLNTLVDHSAASVTPESGQTVTVYISDANTGTLLHTETGITGTTWTYTNALDNSLGAPQFILFKIVAARGGVESWDNYSFRVPRGPGWGFDWGFDWGD